MYTFQIESTLYNCLNVKEPLAQNRYGIWGLSNCNRTQIRNHLVCKRTLNHLAKLVWLNGSVFIYKLSGCGFKSCCSHWNFLNIYQVSKFQVFMETNGSFPYSFVVSNLHLNQWFLIWVQLIAICRGELSVVIYRLMSKYLWSRGSGWKELKR